MGKKVVEIYATTNYGLFRRLRGNRDVTNKRVAIIKESITQVGYISNPVIVNENMEIIDGQGRAEALRQLGLPIEYRIVPGLGIVECRAMNLKPTGWSINDFVKSYAEYGNESYIRLKEIADKYNFGYTLVYSLCKNTTNSGRAVQGDIREGTFTLDEERAKQVDELCAYLVKFKDIQKRVGGRQDLFYGLIGWIALQDGVDKERLRISVAQQANTLSPVAQTEPSLRELSHIYNKGFSKKNCRYFDYEWKTRELA